MATVSASKMTLTIYKGKLKSAELGHRLLEKKRDALKMKFRVVM